MTYPTLGRREPGDPLDERPPAVDAAHRASEAWAAAARLQRWAPKPRHHADFYALAGDVASTVRDLGDLIVTLRAQVAAYASTPRLYDDTRAIRPIERIDAGLAALAAAKAALALAETEVDEFWSAIGHLGVEES